MPRPSLRRPQRLSPCPVGLDAEITLIRVCGIMGTGRFHDLNAAIMTRIESQCGQILYSVHSMHSRILPPFSMWHVKWVEDKTNTRILLKIEIWKESQVLMKVIRKHRISFATQNCYQGEGPSSRHLSTPSLPNHTVPRSAEIIMHGQREKSLVHATSSRHYTPLQCALYPL